MTRPVLVPLDGSEKDARSLPVAAALATLSNSDVHLVRVIEASVAASSARASALGVASAAAELRSAARHALAGLADDLAADTRHTVTWDVLDGTDVAGTLVRYADRRAARFVVMATRAPSAAERVIRGSVADRVMRESAQPVVLVPPGADFLRGKHMQIGRVLVPIDGSAIAARSVDYLLSLPGATTLEYFLLQVVPPGDQLAREEAERRLEAAAERVRARGVAVVDVGVMEDADPGKAIAAAVREVLAELIAMSTRGMGGVRRMVLGSVAEGVVRASEVPVLLLTPAELGMDDAAETAGSNPPGRAER